MVASQPLLATTPEDAPARVAVAPSSSSTPAPQVGSEAWLAIEVNGVPVGTPGRFVRLADGRMLASVDELRRLRIRMPDEPTVVIRGREHVALDAIGGLAFRVDEQSQLLRLDAAPRVFDTTVLLPQGPGFREPPASDVGGFANYDLQLISDGGRAASGWIEVGAFGPHGFGSTSFLGNSRSVNERLVRLESSWVRDDSVHMRSLTVGDAISRPATWGRAVRFGGVQWGSNFAIRPDVVTFARPTLVGEAVLPSSVDVYVDNALRFSGRTPQGPFEIPNAPLMTGHGQVRMVVRDLLGRETAVAQPFHVDAQLLKAGLRDETYEAGFLRERYGSASFDYGGLFVAATRRVGLSDALTAELHAEAMARQQTASAGLAWLWPGVGVVHGAAAVSASRDGAGGLLTLGFRHDGRWLSGGVQTRLATPGFRELAHRAGAVTAREETSAHVSVAGVARGSAYVSFVQRRRPGDADVRLLGAGYSTSLAPRLHVSAFALASLVPDRARLIGFSLTYAFDSRTTVSATGSRKAGEASFDAQAQRSLPAGDGIGWRVAQSTGAQRRTDAALLGQTAVGTYGADLVHTDAGTGWRLSAGGGIAFIDSKLRFARRLDDGFALVKVGEYAGVPVLVDNQEVARTDASGTALVSHLRPYQSNPVRIAAEALPLDAELPRARADVWPRRRSGSVVDFAARPARGALLRIVLDNGAPLPSGALVRVAGGSEQFPVARRGEVYVKGLPARAEVHASWNGQGCAMAVDLPPDAGPLPLLGPYVCKGVRP